MLLCDWLTVNSYPQAIWGCTEDKTWLWQCQRGCPWKVLLNWFWLIMLKGGGGPITNVYHSTALGYSKWISKWVSFDSFCPRQSPILIHTLMYAYFSWRWIVKANRQSSGRHQFWRKQTDHDPESRDNVNWKKLMTLLQVSGPVRLPFWQTSSLSLLPFALKTLL